ncbi:hypothetical protein [Microbacterium gorillae]|uniref:hypothetical protein n=1 Tax=Microbacterium gorillae TaxID=1231063 RepID=UPI003D972A17
MLDSIQVPNRWVATVLEGEYLIHVDEFRAEPPHWIAQVAGATEFWKDGIELPPLQEMFNATCGTEADSAWVTAISRLDASVWNHE